MLITTHNFHWSKKKQRKNTGCVSQRSLVHLKFSYLKISPMFCLEQWTSLPLSGSAFGIMLQVTGSPVSHNSINSVHWTVTDSLWTQSSLTRTHRCQKEFLSPTYNKINCFLYFFFQYSNFTVCLELCKMLQLKPQLTAEKTQIHAGG